MAARLVKLSPLLLAFFFGCTAPGQPANFHYEYVPPEQEALNVVDSTDVSFIVPYADERYASERLVFFMKEIIKGGSRIAGENTATGEKTFMGGSENFIYSVRRMPSSGGVRFTVQCSPRSGTHPEEDAVRNAKNLARFVRSGQLEKKALTL